MLGNFYLEPKSEEFYIATMPKRFTQKMNRAACLLANLSEKATPIIPCALKVQRFVETGALI